MEQIAVFITTVLRNTRNAKRLAEVREEVKSLCERFPLYSERLKDNR